MPPGAHADRPAVSLPSADSASSPRHDHQHHPTPSNAPPPSPLPPLLYPHPSEGGCVADVCRLLACILDALIASPDLVEDDDAREWTGRPSRFVELPGDWFLHCRLIELLHEIYRAAVEEARSDLDVSAIMLLAYGSGARVRRHRGASHAGRAGATAREDASGIELYRCAVGGSCCASPVLRRRCGRHFDHEASNRSLAAFRDWLCVFGIDAVTGWSVVRAFGAVDAAMPANASPAHGRGPRDPQSVAASYARRDLYERIGSGDLVLTRAARFDMLDVVWNGLVAIVCGLSSQPAPPDRSWKAPIVCDAIETHEGVWTLFLSIPRDIAPEVVEQYRIRCA